MELTVHIVTESDILDFVDGLADAETVETIRSAAETDERVRESILAALSMRCTIANL